MEGSDASVVASRASGGLRLGLAAKLKLKLKLAPNFASNFVSSSPATCVSERPCNEVELGGCIGTERSAGSAGSAQRGGSRVPVAVF